jgi:hypothetical protein
MNTKFLESKKVRQFVDTFLKEVFPEKKLPVWVDKDLFYVQMEKTMEAALIGHLKTPEKDFIEFLGPSFFIPFFAPNLDVATDLTLDMKNHIDIETRPPVKELQKELAKEKEDRSLKKTKVNRIKVKKTNSKKEYKNMIRDHFCTELKAMLTTGREDEGMEPLKKKEKFFEKYKDEIEECVNEMYDAYAEDGELEDLRNISPDGFREYLSDKVVKAASSPKLIKLLNRK